MTEQTEANEYLCFEHSGKNYIVNSEGLIARQNEFNEYGTKAFSKNWIFFGVSLHHWRNGIDIYFEDIWGNPELLLHSIVWDKDNGTTRKWSGSYYGKLPRVTRSYKITCKTKH